MEDEEIVRQLGLAHTMRDIFALVNRSFTLLIFPWKEAICKEGTTANR